MHLWAVKICVNAVRGRLCYGCLLNLAVMKEFARIRLLNMNRLKYTCVIEPWPEIESNLLVKRRAPSAVNNIFTFILLLET